MLHDFVPYSGEGEERHYASQGNVGDQLSVERAVNCLLQVSNGYTPEERLEGLHFEAGDFHAGIKFMQVRYKVYKAFPPVNCNRLDWVLLLSCILDNQIMSHISISSCRSQITWLHDTEVRYLRFMSKHNTEFDLTMS